MPPVHISVIFDMRIKHDAIRHRVDCLSEAENKLDEIARLAGGLLELVSKPREAIQERGRLLMGWLQEVGGHSGHIDDVTAWAKRAQEAKLLSHPRDLEMIEEEIGRRSHSIWGLIRDHERRLLLKSHQDDNQG